MNDTYITVVGTVVADPRHVTLASGSRVFSMRVASTARRFDRQAQQWRDADTLYITVRCWRGLSDNAASSIQKGDHVIATGRLQIRSFEKAGVRHLSIELDALSVGHDLSRGVARYSKGRAQVLGDEVRQELDEATDDWAHKYEPVAGGQEESEIEAVNADAMSDADRGESPWRTEDAQTRAAA